MKKRALLGLGATFFTFAALSFANEQKPVNLRISWWGGSERHEKTLEAIKAFEKKNPNIKVSSEYGGWDGHQVKVTTQMIGKTEADIMQINWNWINLFSKDGNGYYNLNDLKNIIDLNNYDSELLKTTTVNGKLNALPYGIGGRVFFYNKAVYDKAGAEIPKSFEDMRKATKQIKDKLGPNYYAFDSGDSYGAFLLVLYNLEQKTGKPFIVDDKVAYTPAELEEGFKFYRSLVKDGVIPSIKEKQGAGNSVLEQHPGWIEGRFGGVYDWNSTPEKWQAALKDTGEVVLGEFPTDLGTNKSALTKVSQAFAISKNTKHPKEAAMLLEYLVADPEAVEILGVRTRGIPSNKKAYANLSSAGEIKGIMDEGYKKVENFTGKGIHPLFEHSELSGYYKKLMEELDYEVITEKQAADMLTKKVNNFIMDSNKKK